MTAMLTKTVTDDLEWVEAGITGVDPESDVGFFSMSPASAEQVTVQIRNVLDRAWEFIALAYKGRAFLALGYASWDEYVDARFGDLRLAVPREHRTQVVATLAGARMSVRAIAKLLGVGVATVHRELVKPVGVPTGTPTELEGPLSTLGRDGKSYPRGGRPTVRPCPTCGEHHPDNTANCPWDLFAQGIGPHPGGLIHPLAAGEENSQGEPAEVSAKSGGYRPSRKRQTGGRSNVGQPGPAASADAAGDGVAPGDVEHLLQRMEASVREFSRWSDLVIALEPVVLGGLSATNHVDGLATRIRGLANRVGVDVTRLSDAVDRLRRVAEALQRE